MNAEGQLAVDLAVSGDRVAGVSVRSTRPTDAARVLVGRPVEEGLALVSSLFAVCGTAHAAAAVQAVEAALGISCDETQRRARRLVCALEAINNHVFQLCVEWSRLLDRSPEVNALRTVLRVDALLRRGALEEEQWARAGGGAVHPIENVSALLGELEQAVSGVVPARALDDEQALRLWAARCELPSGMLLRAVADAGAAGVTLGGVPLVPALPAEWFLQRASAPGLSARPTLDGQPAEAGALSRACDHPLVAAELATRGRTLHARLLAHLADVRRLLWVVVDEAQALRTSSGGARATRSSGVGAGVADTSRGRLAHLVRVADGVVAEWRVVAPTEWTFHPAGVLRGLEGAPALDLHRRVRWLVAALDPCVPCVVHIGEGHA